MEPNLGFLGGTSSCGGGGGGGGLSGTSKNEVAEQDLSGMSTEVSAELELGLGLSLGGGGGGGPVKAKGSPWGEYGRILTAKDFPNGFSNSATGPVSGTKRAADSVSPPVSQVVGWPPIKAYRMNSLVNQAKVPNAEEDKVVEGDGKGQDISKKKVNYGVNNTNTSGKEIKGHLGFVKVNIDGIPIGRKVDLNSHTCYETLARALEGMFFAKSTTISSIRGEKEQATKPSKLLDGSSEFVLTYEDKEGDWMLVGDVPWGMFFSTVHRLRIMRTSEANGLAPRFLEKDARQKSNPV